jgi:hypothetical protein
VEKRTVAAVLDALEEVVTNNVRRGAPVTIRPGFIKDVRWAISSSMSLSASVPPRGIFIPRGFASVRTGKEGREGGSDVYRLRNPGVHCRGSLDHLSRAARITARRQIDNEE